MMAGRQSASPDASTSSGDGASATVEARLAAAGLAAAHVRSLVMAALAEDLDGGEDVTSVATVPVDHRSRADLVSRGAGVVAGIDVAALAFTVAATTSMTTRRVRADGDRIAPGDLLLSVEGRTRDLLLAERTALNLLCHLSGIATLTREWADAVSGTAAQVRDTRKTTPLLRDLEKYAVRCGGGVNHRQGLHDAALVKDNHVVAAGGVVAAYQRVLETFPDVPVQVEVDTVADAVAVAAAGCQTILLDNFDLDQLRETVQQLHGRATLEASGGLTLADARAVAETGVDLVAVGGLTHSAPVLDIGMDLQAQG